jgi:hypothetical protein
MCVLTSLGVSSIIANSIDDLAFIRPIYVFIRLKDNIAFSLEILEMIK